MEGIERYAQLLRSYSELNTAAVHRYKTLLDYAEPLLKVIASQEALRPPGFNIFLLLGYQYRELTTHSTLLAHLLDPAGSHGQKSLFLRGFLSRVEKAARDQGRSFLLPAFQDEEQWHCRTEVRLPNGLGQADILLQGPNLIMIIENKIYAVDQDSQLLRYWRFVSEEGRTLKAVPMVVYLTPDGHAPTAQSIGGCKELADTFVRMSYHEDIYNFVQTASAMTKAVSVSETLRQYASLVRTI